MAVGLVTRFPGVGADKYDAETVSGLKQIEALSRKMRGILEALDR